MACITWPELNIPNDNLSCLRGKTSLNQCVRAAERSSDRNSETHNRVARKYLPGMQWKAYASPRAGKGSKSYTATAVGGVHKNIRHPVCDVFKLSILQTEWKFDPCAQVCIYRSVWLTHVYSNCPFEFPLLWTSLFKSLCTFVKTWWSCSYFIILKFI